MMMTVMQCWITVKVIVLIMMSVLIPHRKLGISVACVSLMRNGVIASSASVRSLLGAMSDCYQFGIFEY